MWKYHILHIETKLEFQAEDKVKHKPSNSGGFCVNQVKMSTTSRCYLNQRTIQVVDGGYRSGRPGQARSNLLRSYSQSVVRQNIKIIFMFQPGGGSRLECYFTGTLPCKVDLMHNQLKLHQSQTNFLRRHFYLPYRMYLYLCIWIGGDEVSLDPFIRRQLRMVCCLGSDLVDKVLCSKSIFV